MSGGPLTVSKAGMLRQLWQEQALTVSCTTWNMGGGLPSEEELAVVLPLSSPDLPTTPLYVIGSQECGRSIVQSLLFPSKEAWEKQLDGHFGTSGFRKVATSTMSALHIAVYIHSALHGLVHDVQVGSVATGFADALGNKGAVAVSFSLGSTSFLFLSCHLAAHQGAEKLRHKNLQRIEAALEMVPREVRLRQQQEEARQAQEGHREQRSSSGSDSGGGVMASAGSHHKNASSATTGEGAEQQGDGEGSSSSSGPRPGRQRGREEQSRGGKKARALSEGRQPSSGASSGGRALPDDVPSEGQSEGEESESEDGSDAEGVSSPGSVLAAAAAGESASDSCEVLQRMLKDQLERDRSAVSRRFDRVFLLGDLNYRLAASRSEVDALVASKDIKVRRWRWGMGDRELGQTEVHAQAVPAEEVRIQEGQGRESQSTPSCSAGTSSQRGSNNAFHLILLACPSSPPPSPLLPSTDPALPGPIAQGS